MKMGFDFGLQSNTACIIRRFRFLFKIPGISASGINSLPPLKSARPNLSFKEMEIPHLHETIKRPAKVEWKPITLTLFDLKKAKNPVFNWLNRIYNPCPQGGGFRPSVGSNFLLNCSLELYDGCGNVIETWVYENAWPQIIEFGELDMGSSEFVTIDLTLNYDRAYILNECG